MPPTRPAESSLSKRAETRRRIPVALSVAVHAAVLYALTRSPLPVSEARTASPAPTPVVWLRELPARELPQPAEPEAEPPPETTAPPPVERVIPPAPQRTARRRPVVETPPPAVAPEPPPQTAPPPRVDWDKERRAAVRDTIENPPGRYKTFTLDDHPARKPEPLPIEPAPHAMAEVMSSRCALYKNRFQAALLGMVGICTRDAADGLFAGARAPYMDEHPECRETRPDSPGAITSDGRVISTVKCELVADRDEVTEVKVEIDLDTPP